MASIIEDLFGFGGPEDAYKAQAGAYRRASHEGFKRMDFRLGETDRFYDQAEDQGRKAYDRSGAELNKGIEGAREAYAPYGNTKAHEMREDFAGVNGRDSQGEAFDNYRESPGVAFLRDRGLRAISRNASARGGLLGENLQKERMAFAQDNAETSFDSYWNKLGELSNNSFQASQNLANLEYSGGVAKSDLEERRGAFDTGITLNRFGVRDNLRANADQNHLQSIIATGEAKANKEIGEGNTWAQLGSAGLAAATAGMGGGGTGMGGFNWGNARNALFARREDNS